MAAALALALTVFLLTATSASSKTETSSAAAAQPQTVVTLTFDDGWADVYQGLAMLNAHNMHATYFLNSPRISGDSAYMTWSNVADLAAAGNEIGGHTAYHADLPFIDPTEAQRQICYDRDNLLQRGYNVTDFAFPFGDYSPAVKTMVQNCGYNSARTTDVFPQANPSGPIPPPDPYQINVGTDTTTLTSMENAVTAARQNGGGWVPITFHHICNACNISYISPSDFNTFLDWLQGQAANNVVVKTMKQVIGGATQPQVPGPGLPPAPNGTNALRNSSLEQESNGDGIPDCWTNDDFGNNNFTWTRTSDAHSGSFAEKLTVTSYVDGDNKLTVLPDLGYCTPSVNEGHRYRITEWYKSDQPVHFTLFTRDSQWQVGFWDSSPVFPASSTWTQASFVTSVIPAGINGLVFGLTLGSNGNLTVDDAGLDDAAASGGSDTTPPTVSLSAPSANSTVSGFVPISATATDNVAVDHVDYLIDGQVAGTLTSGPFTYTWNSRSVANGSHTIRVRAVDLAGNSTTTTAITVFVSNQNNNVLQNPSLEQGTSNPPSCWLLGGYGTNTVTWTWTADAHTGTHGENLNISAWTNGDRKLLTAFSSACSPAVIPGHTYTISGWYKSSGRGPVFMAFSTTSGGNGAYSFLAQSSVLANAAGWTQASWSTPSIPAGVTNLSIGMGITGGAGSVTMDDFALSDNAPAPDTTPPTSDLACNGGGEDGTGCAATNGWFNSPVEIDLSATDDPGGSGVARIVYTLDGSTPSATQGSTYTGPFSVGQTTTVKYLAIDKAGNVESPAHSQLVQIDTQPPSATIACNNNPCGSGSFNNAVSVTMNATDTGGSGLNEITYTLDGTTPSLTNGIPYLGAFSVNTNTTIKFVARDRAGNFGAVNTEVLTVDATEPVSTIQCNGAACAGSYSAAVNVTLSATDNPGGSGAAGIYYTTDGTDPTSSTGTPYLTSFVVSATTTVKYRAYDNAGNAEATNTQLITIDTTPTDTTPPTSTIQCNGAACGSWFNAPISVTLSATDDSSGVNKIVYTTDGSNPTLNHGNVYSGAFTVSASSTTVKYRAFDNAGNAEATHTKTLQIETTAPTTTIKCNATTCGSGYYTASVSVTLTATDSGGSGVSQIVYTTDGSDPTQTNGTVYSGAFTLSATTTVKYRAYDVAGNAEAVKSQQIQVDSVSPTSTISCNGNPCGSGWFNGAVSITLAATDNSGGSGVSQIRYTTDGTTPTATTGNVYTGAFTVSTSGTTVKYRAFDVAGNAETTNSQLLQIDAVASSSMLRCNGSTCAASFYSAAVSVTLTASDVGGSGVNMIVYTTDGSDPTQTNGTVYSGAFTLSATTTVKYRAYDNAGNAEPINSALLQVDTTPPSTTLNCAGSPCSGSSWYLSGVSLSLTSSDTDSGVAQIRYTTNGTVPTKTTGTIFTSPFAINATTTINYRAYDNAGNLESNHALTVQIDPTAPTATLTAPNTGATVSGTVTLSATAADGGGSGLARVDFLVDGNVVGSAGSSPYSYSWNSASVTDGNHTIVARAVDGAGNQGSSTTITVTTGNTSLLQNPGLESGSGNTPTCWALGGYGTNTFSWTWTTDAHSGSHAEDLKITSYTNGDRKLLNAFNGTCSIATAAGRRYTITVWYKSTARPVIFAFTSTTGPTGGYSFLGQSPLQSLTSTWQQATWTTPAMPAGTTNLSIGMGLTQAGEVWMDDFAAFQTG